MSTVARELQLLRDTKADIIDALEYKHAVVPEKFIDYGDAIRNIPQNEAPNPMNPIKFVDYDGTLLYSYGVDATATLSALPELPERQGLSCQGWNYTLEQLKTQAQTIGKCIVGCNYITEDGKTRFYITIRDPKFRNFRLGLGQTAKNSFTIDWGDNTALSGPYGQTGYTVRIHEYSPTSYPASYVITISNDGGGTGKVSFPGAIVTSATQTGAPSGNNAQTQATAQGSMFDKIELGDIGSTLGNHALHWITSVKTINIPKCVTTIGQYSLAGWDAAKGIIIPNSVTSIGQYVFAYDYATEMISLPPTINTIPVYCFRNCRALMELVMPYTITSIGQQAFYECGAMQDLRFPTAITSIGQETFYNCAAIPTLVFDGNATISGKNVFYGCNSLKSVNIPANTTTISEKEFYACNTIQRLVFEGDIASIGTQAFYACHGLRTIDFRNCTTVPQLTVDALTSLPISAEIIVPDALYTDWTGASNWSTLSNLVFTKASEA